MSRARDTLRDRRSAVWSGLALLYLFIPIFIVILFSFNDNKGRFNFTWQGFTLRHWEHPFANRDLTTALQNSLVIAAHLDADRRRAGHVHGARARALRVPRTRRRPTSSCSCRWRRPRSCSAPRCSALFLTLHVSTGLVTIVIAHVMFTVSYVVVTVKARLEGMDRHIEEAAMDLGATEWTTFRKITLPMIAPGVAAAGLLAAAISVDDYVITSFNAGQTQTFPLFIFGATRQGVPAEVNVLASLLLIVVLVLMVVNVMVQKAKARRDLRATGAETLDVDLELAGVPARA